MFVHSIQFYQSQPCSFMSSNSTNIKPHICTASLSPREVFPCYTHTHTHTHTHTTPNENICKRVLIAKVNSPTALWSSHAASAAAMITVVCIARVQFP
jgi:hypothetical protein